MDFFTLIITTLAITSVISAMDKFLWQKQRQLKLESALERKRQMDFVARQEILKRPEWIEFASSLFWISIVALVVWTMLPNFELILVVALFASLVITLIEKLYVEKKKKAELQSLYQRNANPHEKEVEAVQKMPWWIDYGWSFFPLLLVIVVLRSFVYEPFKIPSGSMKPTLWVHDFILVNKFEYGLRLPVTKTKITEGVAPKRGDVVVFRAPHEPEKDYIKRLVGLPGDVVYYDRDKNLFITPNCAHGEVEGLICGQKNLIRRTLVEQAGFEGADIYSESLAGVEHQILIERRSQREELFIASRHATDWSQGIIIPEGQYFVMGDNRDNSSDSRFWGFVPEYRMVGKAEAVWMHLEFNLAESGILSYIPTGVKFSRVGAIE